MLSTVFSTNCAPNFIQNPYYLLLGIRVPKTKDLSAQWLTNHVFYVNFGYSNSLSNKKTYFLLGRVRNLLHILI